MIDAEPPPAAPRRRHRGRASPPRHSPRPAAAPSKASPGSAGRPKSKASLLYRFLRLVGRFVLFGVFRFRIRTVRPGAPAERRLPPRRSRPPRLDGPVRRHARDPGQPRAWFLGSAPSTFTSPLARAAHPPARWLAAGLARRRRGRHARRVGARGRSPMAAVFVQMPEGTVSGPPGRIGPFRAGWAVIALRADPPIVPLAIAGTEELYLGRRLASRILPATTVRALAGLEPGAVAACSRQSREELDLARRIRDALAAAPRAGRRGALPADGRPAGPSATAAQAPDLAAAQARPPRPRRLTAARSTLTAGILGRDALCRDDPRPRRTTPARPHQPAHARPRAGRPPAAPAGQARDAQSRAARSRIASACR